MLYQVRKRGLLSQLVWRSTPESVQSRRVSVLACLEVVGSVAIYWWIAWQYETVLHLLLSVFIVPAVLLRSNSSVETSKYLWIGASSIKKVHLYVTFPLALMAILSVILKLGSVRLSTILLLSILVAASYYSILVLKPRKGALKMYYDPLAKILFYMSLMTGVPAFLIYGVILSQALGFLLILLILNVAMALPFGFFIWMKSIIVRAIANLIHVKEGVLEISKNWYRLSFSTDLFVQPELFPGIEDIDEENTLDSWLNDAHGGPRNWMLLVPLAAWLVPVTLYRYSFKATCWFYLPMLYAIRVPGRLRGLDGRKLLLRAFNRDLLEWSRFAMAVAALGIAGMAIVEPRLVQKLFQMRDLDVPITPYHYFFVIDWDAEALRSYHIVSLSTAALTCILFFWVNRLHVWEHDPLDWQVTAVLVTINLRNALIVTWLMISLYAFMGDAYRLCLLPPEFDWLSQHYGDKLCPKSNFDS